MIDAVRRLVDNGIKWRSMPADFPAWHRVYAFFRRWRTSGLLTEFHNRLRGRVRESGGRPAGPTAGIIGSQSVRAASSVPAATRGYDGGRKVPGRKRHMVTDCLGLLLVIAVTTPVRPDAWPSTGPPRSSPAPSQGPAPPSVPWRGSRPRPAGAPASRTDMICR